MPAFKQDSLKLFCNFCVFKNDNWGNTKASFYLNPFQADVRFYTPWKHKNTSGLLMFSECIEMEHRLEKGEQDRGNKLKFKGRSL